MDKKIPLSAEIVTSGTELLLGDVVDTNAAWIAQQLREIGVNLYYKTTVGDNEPRLRSVLELGLARSDVILVTGGLGPTADDITRDAIAHATGCPLRQHEEIVHDLQERFARWGYRRMSENNLRQAYIPEGATVLENPVGTAPGFIVTDRRHGRGARVIAMPGVPREMKRMMADRVLPYLQKLTGGVGVIRRRILRTVGIGESTIDARLAGLMESANPTIGLAAHLGQADVRIAARAATVPEAEALLDGLESQVRERIGPYIYSTTPGETVEAVLVRLLAQQSASLALLESTTGGAVAARIRATEGGSAVLVADWTLGAVDRPSFLAGLDLAPTAGGVERAAEALGRETGATFALAILGSGRPGETFHSQEAGETWIAVAGPAGIETLRFPFGGTDRLTTAWVGNRALDLVRRLLLRIPV